MGGLGVCVRGSCASPGGQKASPESQAQQRTLPARTASAPHPGAEAVRPRQPEARRRPPFTDKRKQRGPGLARQPTHQPLWLKAGMLARLWSLAG